MPTSVDIKNLKINKLTEAQYDTAVQGGVIGENELSVLTDVELEQIQVSALPTASADELGKIYQYIGATDSTYTNAYFYKCVSDGQSPATYSWTQVNVMPAGSSLPSQTGNAGKFLKTNGTDASWGSAVENIATGQRSFIVGGDNTNSVNDFISIGYSTSSTVSSIGGVQCVQIGGYAKTSNTGGTSIGYSSTASGSYSTALGNNCYAGTGNYNVAIGAKVSISNSSCVAVGANAIADSSSIAIGGAANNYTSAQATNNSIAIGCNAHATATKSIQLGEGSNSTANTFKVANANGNFELMSADGTIPKERLVNAVSKPSTMPELTVAGWSNNTQTVTVTGVTATNTVFVSPAPASASDYSSAGIICTAQGTDSLTFTCTTVPTNAITVNVVIMG